MGFSGRIEKFAVVNEHNHESDLEFDTFEAARSAAGNNNAVVRRIYDFQDSVLVWTPDGSNDWPPRKVPPVGEVYFTYEGRWYRYEDSVHLPDVLARSDSSTMGGRTR